MLTRLVRLTRLAQSGSTFNLLAHSDMVTLCIDLLYLPRVTVLPRLLCLLVLYFLPNLSNTPNLSNLLNLDGLLDLIFFLRLTNLHQ